MPNSERFKLIVQGELSYAVEFDGQHMDEWSERDGAEAYIEFWSGKLTLERAEARREALTEAIAICDEVEDYSREYNNRVGAATAGEICELLRSKLAAPEKEETRNEQG